MENQTENTNNPTSAGEKEEKKEVQINFKLTKNHLIFAGVLLLLTAVAAAYYYAKPYLLAATVNGQPVTRLEILKESEKSAGAQILDGKVTEVLIDQELKKRKIEVSGAEVDKEINNIKDRLKQNNQDFDTIMKQQGYTMDDLKKLINRDLAVKKMFADQIDVTDEEVTKYMEENKDSLPTEGDAEELKKTVKDQLSQQELNTAFQTWLTEAKQKASIKYFVDYAQK